MFRELTVAFALLSAANAQDLPPQLGDHFEPSTAIDREHVHHANVTGRVLTADGEPAVGALVCICTRQPFYGSAPAAWTRTDETGAFRLSDVEAVGSRALFAVSPPTQALAVGQWSLGLASGRDHQLRPMTLPEAAAGSEATPHTFRGRLVTEAGAPIGGAVWCLHHESAFDPSAFAVTAADGSFEITTRLGRPSTATLSIGPRYFRIEHADDAADLDAESWRTDLDLATERTIRVRSLEAIELAAEAAEGAEFHQQFRYGMVRCIGDVAHRKTGDRGDQSVGVVASSPAHLPRWVRVPRQPVDFGEDRERRLLVLDEAGEAVPDAVVDVCGASSGRLQEPTLRSYRTDASGALTLRGPVDDYVVYVYSPRHAPARARWTDGAPLKVALRERSATLKIRADTADRSLYIRPAGSFACTAILYPSEGVNEVRVAPGVYELTSYGEQITAAQVEVEGDVEVAMPTDDERPRILVDIQRAGDEKDQCWAHASRSAAGGMITKWSIHSQRGGPLYRHELAAMSTRRDGELEGVERFEVRPPTSGRYTLLVGNGSDGTRYFRDVFVAFGGSYEITLPAATCALQATVKDYPEMWINGAIHGICGPRLCLEPTDGAPFGAIVALPEPATFELANMPAGTFTLHHHLYETGILFSEEGTWGGASVTLKGDEAVDVGELARGPDAELTVSVVHADGRPVEGMLSVRDRMFDAWQDDLRQNTTLDDARDPIPNPPSARLVDGKAVLTRIRSGRVAFVVDLDDGGRAFFTRDVRVGKEFEVTLPAASRR